MYGKQIKRELTGIHRCGCPCDERLIANTDGSKRLAYTVLRGEFEHKSQQLPTSMPMGACREFTVPPPSTPERDTPPRAPVPRYWGALLRVASVLIRICVFYFNKKESKTKTEVHVFSCFL